MKYTVTVKDNETGEVLINEECKAAICTIGKGDSGEHGFSFASCNGLEMCALLHSAIENIERFEKRNPEIAFLVSTILDKETKGKNEDE